MCLESREERIERNRRKDSGLGEGKRAPGSGRWGKTLSGCDPPRIPIDSCSMRLSDQRFSDPQDRAWRLAGHWCFFFFFFFFFFGGGGLKGGHDQNNNKARDRHWAFMG